MRGAKTHPSDTSLYFASKKKREGLGKTFLYSVDELPEFHDPFSELNLFLSRKIKEEMGRCDCSKKWSLKLQEEFIQKIAPDFQKQFPHYRLGVTALRKTWQRIVSYSQQLQEQKQALTQDGRLNVPFLIKENLKQFSQLKGDYRIHPYHYANQLALKISECIATVDGTRPDVDLLSKTIWAVQRQLLKTKECPSYKSPYDEYDKVDKLVVHTILEILAKDPQIGQMELEQAVREAFDSLHELPSFCCSETVAANIAALFAEKIYPSSPIHTLLAEQKGALLNFIRRHSALCKLCVPAPQLSELVRRIVGLYALASEMPKHLTTEQIRAATLASYPYNQKEKPPLPQSIYAFISAELVLMRNEHFCHSVEHVTQCILKAYEETKFLPKLEGKACDLLEIATWKVLSEMDGLLEKLPYRTGQRIEEQITRIVIDHPTLHFSGVIYETLQFFKKVKEVAQTKKISQLHQKIHTWTLQSDMLCRWIKLDHDTPLFQLVCEVWTNRSVHKGTHADFVSTVCQEYLRRHPELTPYAASLMHRIWILYRYAWYALFASDEETALDRFIKWHLLLITPSSTQKLQEICQKRAPLLSLPS